MCSALGFCRLFTLTFIRFSFCTELLWRYLFSLKSLDTTYCHRLLYFSFIFLSYFLLSYVSVFREEKIQQRAVNDQHLIRSDLSVFSQRKKKKSFLSGRIEWCFFFCVIFGTDSKSVCVVIANAIFLLLCLLVCVHFHPLRCFVYGFRSSCPSNTHTHRPMTFQHREFSLHSTWSTK